MAAAGRFWSERLRSRGLESERVVTSGWPTRGRRRGRCVQVDACTSRRREAACPAGGVTLRSSAITRMQWRGCALWQGWSGERENEFHLDRRIEGKHGHTDSGARVASGVSEDLTE